MKKRYAFMLGIIISLATGIANAQPVNPDIMLNVQPNPTLPPTPEPAPEQDDQSSMDDVFWADVRLLCSKLDIVRHHVENVRSEMLWIVGVDHVVTDEPKIFDGVIITKNIHTNAYSVILVNQVHDVGCIGMHGTAITLVYE